MDEITKSIEYTLGIVTKYAQVMQTAMEIRNDLSDEDVKRILYTSLSCNTVQICPKQTEEDCRELALALVSILGEGKKEKAYDGNINIRYIVRGKNTIDVVLVSYIPTGCEKVRMVKKADPNYIPQDVYIDTYICNDEQYMKYKEEGYRLVDPT